MTVAVAAGAFSVCVGVVAVWVESVGVVRSGAVRVVPAAVVPPPQDERATAASRPSAAAAASLAATQACDLSGCSVRREQP